MKAKSPKKPKTRSEAEKQGLVRLVRDGVQAPKISVELGRYTGSIKRMAREMRLVLKK